MKNLIPKYVGIVLYLFVFCCEAKGFKLNEGDVPPDFLGIQKGGQEVFVSAQKGKVVVISFWASWCGPCKKEIPVLDHMQRQLGTDIIKVVAINHKESTRQYHKIKKIFKTSDITLTHDRSGKISKEYGVSGIPHLVIIGKDGRIVYQKRGYRESSLDELVPIINKQLAVAYSG